eukprot:CAMPEP_0202686244 /NCGR_PEP_ID=MMETSP1385-20130828/2054_1 /ASSEMBLY_ACC=CAM_ASM_000861 /TAXON_ID=933848 /ORGANISM="Elphidium margaritaceum" /LENGTH=406 /DNA_ID=CAMNT_0049340777 /DNA_START=123 /DNA_END=1346 /DNA_ORIENTATION=+
MNRIHLFRTTAAAILFAFNLCAGADTVLDEQFCQVIYSQGLGDDGCPAVRANVRSEVRGDGTPTLEMGDPSNPALVFFHGWPDTSALWANQFARFCGEDGNYFCVAPSLQDCHPDFPLVDDSELLWSTQVTKLHAVVVELGLSDITLVVHDFGAIFGHQFVSRWPELVSRLVGMDIGFAPVDPAAGVAVLVPFDGLINFFLPFQQAAIEFFLTNDDEGLQDTLEALSIGETAEPPPCILCQIAPGATNGTVGARTGWLHYNWVRLDFPWPSFFEEPVANWEFNWMPTFPADVPYLFLWSSEGFISAGQLEWIDARGAIDGVSEQMQYDSDIGHWFMVREASAVNDKIASWLFATEPEVMDPSTTVVDPSTTDPSTTVVDVGDSGDDAVSFCIYMPVALLITVALFV